MEIVEQKPVELTLGDGTVVKGASLEEAFKTVAKMKEDTAAELKRVGEEAERYKEQAETYGSELQQYKQPEVKDGEFDKNKYYKLLNEDPREAANYLDAYRFGTPDPVQRFGEIGQKVDSLYQQSLTASFWARHPEFPGGREAAKAMTDKVSSLTNNGHPLSIETMELAYADLTREEIIKPTKKEEVTEERPNPSLGSGGGNQPAINDEKLWSMTDEQFKAYARANGLKI